MSSPALYRVLRQALRFALDLYFVDIQSTGDEHVPLTGPVIFAANHPNSIMDTMLLGTRVDRQVHYLARSGLFGNPLVAALFNQVGVIPLYRAQDGEDMTHNRDSFERAFEILSEGKCLGIFPEGQNSQERRLLRLKTGTARIALGAEARQDFKLGVKIIPVGLNFQDRDQFLSGVLIRFGPPLDISTWKTQHAQDEREAVKALTTIIELALQEQATHIEHTVAGTLSATLLRISGKDWADELASAGSTLHQEIEARALGTLASGSKRNWLDRLKSVPASGSFDAEFAMEHDLAHALEVAAQEAPERLNTLLVRTERYQAHLKQLKLRQDFGVRDPRMISSRKEALKLTSFALLASPLAGFGLLHNILPYQLTKQIALRAPDEAIRAMTALCAGMVIFGLAYGAMGWWLSRQMPWWGVSLYLLAMAITGFFFLKYRRVIAGWRARILVRTMFRTERQLTAQLMSARDQLLDEARELLEVYGPSKQGGARG